MTSWPKTRMSPVPVTYALHKQKTDNITKDLIMLQVTTNATCCFECCISCYTSILSTETTDIFFPQAQCTPFLVCYVIFKALLVNKLFILVYGIAVSFSSVGIRLLAGDFWLFPSVLCSVPAASQAKGCGYCVKTEVNSNVLNCPVCNGVYLSVQ